MSNGVKNLIDAIESGDSLAIDAAFNSEVANRISDKLDVMRQDLAQNMFKEQHEELDEATGNISSGRAQHDLASGADKKEHSDYMNKTHGVKTTFHGDDELSYHGPKANVKKAIKNHYNDDEQAKDLHPKVFKEQHEELDEK